MFTINQIKQAHAKVKSGADFPIYVQDIIKLGVTKYESFVSDGNAIFYGTNNYQQQWEAKYATLPIASNSNQQQFITQLKAHQQGKTDYRTFCEDCAKWGIEKWVVNLTDMTCTYYNKAGEEILVEKIPTA